MARAPEPPFQVSNSQRVAEQTRELGQLAATRGAGALFAAAVRTIHERLESAPLEWGEPRYHLRAMGLLVCHAIHAMLHVSYAVDEARRIVYILAIEPVPHGLLDQDPQ